MRTDHKRSIPQYWSIIGLACLLGGFLAVGIACTGPHDPADALDADPVIEFVIAIPGSPPVASARSTILTDGSIFKVKVYGFIAGTVTAPTVLTKVGDYWRGTAVGLGVGEYQFYVWAYATDGSVLYFGKTGSNVVITGEETASVSITTTAAASAVIPLRSVGPAGGLIFHDYDPATGSVHPDGWRFMETAPPVTEDYLGTQWQTDTRRIVGTADRSAVGTGQANTTDIVAWQTGQGMSGTAAMLCDSLSLTDNEITYADWFLPSMSELYTAYVELEDGYGYGGFLGDEYWTSTEVDLDGTNANACYIDFASGTYGLEYNLSKTTGLRVRPIRAFSAAPLYTVSYDANGGSAGTPPADPAFYVSGQTVTVLDNTDGLLGPVLRDGIRQRFLGWSTNSAATTADYTAGSTFALAGNTTLYAIYTSDTSAVGKVGPAGGWIAYDKGVSYTNGWRYLEAAPASTEWTGKLWSQLFELVGNTDMNRDWGKQSTERIVQWLDANTNDAGGDVTNKADRAAYLPYQLTYGGFSDWFLPSMYEMQDVLTNLRAGDNLGELSTDPYWTSSETDTNSVRRDDGASYAKSNAYRVRAVRTFRDAAQETYAVVYYANGATGGTVTIDLAQYHATQSVTLAGVGTLVRTGYVLSGWNTKADGTGTDYEAGSTAEMPAGNLVLYAKWVPRPGSLDTEWSLSSALGSGPSRMAIDGDGNIFLSWYYSSSYKFARYLSTGTMDSGFVTGTGFNGQPTAILPRSDGKVYITGDITTYNGSTVNRFFRLTSTGSIDTSIPTDTGLNYQVMAVAELSSGKILLAGMFTTYGAGTPVTVPRLIRLNADGTLDTTFNTGGAGPDNTVTAMAVQSDGTIIIAGDFTTYNGTARARIARVDAEGTLDTTFNPGTGADGDANWIYPLAGGQFLLAGLDFSVYNGTSTGRIARINSDGSLDTTFNTGGAGANSLIYAAAVQADGKILLGGLFTTYNGTAANGLARLNADGTLDTTFDIGTGLNTGSVSAIAVQPDGKILIGGGFTSYDGTARNHVARLHP